MSVRNSGSTLGPAIYSLIRQTYPGWELVLIDDGSTDETPRIASALSDPRIRFVRRSSSAGLAIRLNEAIALARAPYFARMDGDDIAYPTRFERQLAFMEEHPDVDLVGTGALVFRGDGLALGKRVPPASHEAITRRPTGGFPLAHPTFFGRLEFFQRFLYRTSAMLHEDQDLLLRAVREDLTRSTYLPLAQDQDLLLRSYRKSRFANIPDILLGYREERLSLKKMLRTRSYLCRSLFDEFTGSGQYHLAARALGGQVVRGAVDITAVGTGLGYRVLRHRAAPLEDAEIARWDDVWRSVHNTVEGDTE